MYTNLDRDMSNWTWTLGSLGAASSQVGVDVENCVGEDTGVGKSVFVYVGVGKNCWVLGCYALGVVAGVRVGINVGEGMGVGIRMFVGVDARCRALVVGVGAGLGGCGC